MKLTTGYKKPNESGNILLDDGSSIALSTFLKYLGWWTSGNGNNVDDANGLIFAYQNHGTPSGWGILSTFDYLYNSSYKMLLFSNGYDNGYTYYRNKSADRGGWNPWVRFLDSVNYTSFAVPLSGGTMTGALTTTALTVTGAATFSLAINGNILGNAATASRLLNARTISLTGRVTGSASFDGSSNISIDSTVARARFGDGSNEEHNCNNITMNGMWYYSSNGPLNLGEQSTDGALYSQAYSTSWVAQIALDYRDGRLYIRSKNSGTWKKWYAVALSGEEFDLRNGVTFNPITQLFYFDGGGHITSKKYYRNCIVKFKAPTGQPFIRVLLTNTPGTTNPIGGFKFVKNSTTAYAQTVNTDSYSFTYASTDYFSLEAINGTLYFYLNSTLIYSCTYTPNNFKVYIYGNGSDAFTLPEVNINPLPITWFSSTLSGLTDTNISSSPATGLFLKYNGSKWVNSDPPYPSIATSWIDSTSTRGLVSPTMTGDTPNIFIPRGDYAAFPVMLDSDGNLWVALPKNIIDVCDLTAWQEA